MIWQLEQEKLEKLKWIRDASWNLSKSGHKDKSWDFKSSCKKIMSNFSSWNPSYVPVNLSNGKFSPVESSIKK